MKKIQWILGTLAAVSLFAMVGCGSDTKTAEAPKADTVIKEIVVGTNPSFAPFEFTDQKDGKVMGFDIDMINALAKKAGIEKVTIKSIGFDGLIPSLESGNIDVVITGMSITDARKQKVNFTDPYYESGLMAIVRKDNEAIKGLDDLKGKTIAVQMGTVGADAAAKIQGAKVKTFDSSDLACLELKNGGCDAVISDLPVLQYFLKQGGSAYAKSVGEPQKGDFYGIATNKKDKALGDALNKALADMKKDGSYKQLYEKWFGAEK